MIAPLALRTLLATLLGLALPAQATAPVLLHATACGPVAWRSRVGPTNFGSLLATEQAAAIWRPYVDRVDAALRTVRGADEAFVAERARLLDYGGAMHLVAWLEQAESAVHLPRWSCALIAEPDGHTDLSNMAKECEAWLQRAGAGAASRWLELELAPPRLHEGRMIAVLASAEDLAAASERAERFVGRPLDGTCVFRLEVEVQSTLGLLRDRTMEREFVAALLGRGVQRATIELGNVGPQLAFDLSLAFGAGDRGIAGALVPPNAGVAELSALIPDDTATHYAWRVDFPGLWQAAVNALAVRSECDVPTYRERLRKVFGCDVGQDIASRLGTQVLLLWRRSGVAETDDASLLANACFVAPVNDERALIAAAEPVLRKIDMRCQTDDDGVLYCESADVSLRIGFGVACIAFGERSATMCAAVIERAAVRRRNTEQPRPPAGAPPGWNGQGRIEVTTMFARDFYGQLRWLLFAFGGIEHLPQVIEVQQEAERWLPLLRQQQLDAATTLGGSTERGWQLRILW